MTDPAIPVEIAPPRPRRKKGPLLIATLVVLLVVAMAAVVLVLGSGQKIRYEIETDDGTAGQISWAVDNSGVEREPASNGAGGSKVSTPWQKTVEFNAENQQAAVAVDGATGTATCRIYLNGRIVSEASGLEGVLCQTVLP